MHTLFTFREHLWKSLLEIAQKKTWI